MNNKKIILAKRWAEWAKNQELGEDVRAAVEIIQELPKPIPPTLADLSAERRSKCQWMQAKVFGSDSTSGIILSLGDSASTILFTDGVVGVVEDTEVTPIPEAPLFEWPERIEEIEF